MTDQLSAGTVLDRAIESARRRVDEIMHATQLLNVLDGIGTPLVDGALFWLAQKIRADLYEIGLDLDHAEQARRGETFSNSSERFATPEDVRELLAAAGRATVGAAGRRPVDEADRGGVS